MLSSECLESLLDPFFFFFFFFCFGTLGCYGPILRRSTVRSETPYCGTHGSTCRREHVFCATGRCIRPNAWEKKSVRQMKYPETPRNKCLGKALFLIASSPQQTTQTTHRLCGSEPRHPYHPLPLPTTRCAAFHHHAEKAGLLRTPLISILHHTPSPRTIHYLISPSDKNLAPSPYFPGFGTLSSSSKWDVHYLYP